MSDLAVFLSVLLGAMLAGKLLDGLLIELKAEGCPVATALGVVVGRSVLGLSVSFVCMIVNGDQFDGIVVKGITLFAATPAGLEDGLPVIAIGLSVVGGKLLGEVVVAGSAEGVTVIITVPVAATVGDADRVCVGLAVVVEKLVIVS